MVVKVGTGARAVDIFEWRREILKLVVKEMQFLVIIHAFALMNFESIQLPLAFIRSLSSELPKPRLMNLSSASYHVRRALHYLRLGSSARMLLFTNLPSYHFSLIISDNSGPEIGESDLSRNLVNLKVLFIVS
jgi:hypothetical protein